MTGIDLSAYAVQRAAEESARTGLSADFSVGDMRFPPPGPFDEVPKARAVAAFQTVPSEVPLAYRFERFRPAR